MGKVVILRGVDMRVSAIFAGAARFIASVFGAGVGKTARLEAVTPAKAAPVAPMVPAVAGYVQRIQVNHFMLALRLQSTARLNTIAGRTPFKGLQKAASKPAVPAGRIGAKKRRAQPTSLRVLRHVEKCPTPRMSAKILPFPTALGVAAKRPVLLAIARFSKAA